MLCVSGALLCKSKHPAVDDLYCVQKGAGCRNGLLFSFCPECFGILQAALEVQKDAVEPGQKVIVLDDLVATGGESSTELPSISL